MDAGRKSNFALAAGAVLVSLMLFEAGSRLLVEPSETAYGLLFGEKLAPVRIVGDPEGRLADPRDWQEGVESGGQRLSRGDLFGHHRTDPVLGFTHQENAVSRAGWWQSNNFGARARFDVDRRPPSGVKRVLVFGESFAHGSRVPQEHAWPNIMNEADPETQVLNLAVDGYGMAQAVLRYQGLRERLEYDEAVLMFVPDADLWRDVNTIRDLAERGWNLPLVLPRFVMTPDGLEAALPPYRDPLQVFPENADGISPELDRHLTRYDRFYFPYRHSVPPVIGATMTWKVLVQVRWRYDTYRVRAGLYQADSEAMEVSRAMFAQMADEVAADGARFTLVVLPIRYEWRESPGRADWEAMVDRVCPPRGRCLDLLGPLSEVPVAEIDYALDQSHYGPLMNGRIAQAVASFLAGEGGRNRVGTGPTEGAPLPRAGFPEPAGPRDGA